MRRVLIIGNGVEDKYIGNIIRECNDVCDSISFDFFDIQQTENCMFKQEVRQYTSVHKHAPYWMYAVPKLRGYLNYRDQILSLKEYVRFCREQNIIYDVCQIHYLVFVYAYVASDLKMISKKLVLTPWGSDVLRAPKKMLKDLKKLVQFSDVVTALRGSRFEQDVIRILDVPQNKLYDLTFGVKSIDAILEHQTVTTQEAKKAMGMEGAYTIVIGYNANLGHNHLKVIDKLATIKEQLPHNYLLVLPLTYGGNLEYKAQIRSTLESHQFHYLILEKYMSNVDIVNLRMATDLFIHAQNSDANAGTIAEYLLCQKKIINPTWITYPHHEIYGSPFYSFSSFDELPNVVLSAIQDPSCKVSPLLKENIRKCGWKEKSKEWVAFYTNI